MEAQRLRNLTTGYLHTVMLHIYQDIEYLTGAKGIMTHMLPNACRALEPCLREKVTDAKFWDGKHDPDHTGEYNIQPMGVEESKAFWARYSKVA